MTTTHPRTADGGCEFGLCDRQAEMAVTLFPDVAALKVCALHVSPVVIWGSEAAPDPRIRALPL